MKLQDDVKKNRFDKLLKLMGMQMLDFCTEMATSYNGLHSKLYSDNLTVDFIYRMAKLSSAQSAAKKFGYDDTETFLFHFFTGRIDPFI